MNVLEAISKQRSVKRFLDRLVEHEKVESMLKAALGAPSAARQKQVLEFIVVRNRHKLEKLCGTSNYDGASAAPLAIVSACNCLYLVEPQYWQQEAAVAGGHLMLAAVELGLASLWLGVAPNRDRMRNLATVLKLPGHILPFAVFVIGYPVEEDEEAECHFDPGKIHYEHFHDGTICIRRSELAASRS